MARTPKHAHPKRSGNLDSPKHKQQRKPQQCVKHLAKPARFRRQPAFKPQPQAGHQLDGKEHGLVVDRLQACRAQRLIQGGGPKMDKMLGDEQGHPTSTQDHSPRRIPVGNLYDHEAPRPQGRPGPTQGGHRIRIMLQALVKGDHILTFRWYGNRFQGSHLQTSRPLPCKPRPDAALIQIDTRGLATTPLARHLKKKTLRTTYVEHPVRRKQLTNLFYGDHPIVVQGSPQWPLVKTGHIDRISP